MKILIAIVFSLAMLPSFAQIDVVQSPYMANKPERLCSEAYSVFKTNKFLNFKGKDIVQYYISDSLYKQENLYDYFSYEKDWDEIALEDTATYRKSEQGYGGRTYTYTDSTMTEYYAKGGTYSISRDMKIVLNARGFVLLEEETVSIEDRVVETRSTINEYDKQSRVTRSIRKIEKPNATENTQAVTVIKYSADTVTVTTEDGTVRCVLLKDANSIGYVSKLNALETYDRFKYAIYGKRYKDANKHSSEGMQLKMAADTAFYNTIDSIAFGNGTSTHRNQHVRFVENWTIKFANGTAKIMLAEADIKQLDNGWKITAFTLKEEAN